MLGHSVVPLFANQQLQSSMLVVIGKQMQEKYSCCASPGMSQFTCMAEGDKKQKEQRYTYLEPDRTHCCTAGMFACALRKFSSLDRQFCVVHYTLYVSCLYSHAVNVQHSSQQLHFNHCSLARSWINLHETNVISSGLDSRWLTVLFCTSTSNLGLVSQRPFTLVATLPPG